MKITSSNVSPVLSDLTIAEKGANGGGGDDTIEVGGDVSAVNKIALLAPWIALVAVIIAGATIVMRRRLTQS